MLPFFVLAGCGSGAGPSGEDKPPSSQPAAKASGPAAPSLSKEPTGHHNGDHLLDVDRCVKTAWSYHGCDQAYPVQGRKWIAFECEHRASPPKDIGSALSNDQLDSPTLDRELAQVKGKPAAPKSDADRYRATVCTRYAEYQIRGVGGPVEREAGMQTMAKICDGGDRTACASLARLLAFDGDTEAARPLFQTGCEEDPGNSPAGLCADLRDVFAGGLLRWEFQLTEAKGAELSVGDRCTAWVLRHVAPNEGPWIRDEAECEAQLTCGTRILYGDGGSVCPCSFESGQLRAGETMTTGTDGDPAFSVDTKAQTLTLRDDESGELGAFELRAQITSGPPSAAGDEIALDRDCCLRNDVRCLRETKHPVCG
jgi:hypothetical protein